MLLRMMDWIHNKMNAERTVARAGIPVHNFRSDAEHQWGTKVWQKLQKRGPQHQFCRQWRPQKKDTPCLSRPMEPLLFSPAVALPLQDSWHSPYYPTLPSLASPTLNVGRVKNAGCLGSFANFRRAHESEQRRPYNKYSKKNSWAFSKYLWAQSRKN